MSDDADNGFQLALHLSCFQPLLSSIFFGLML